MIKILTLNLWRYNGEWNLRKSRIVDFIIKQKPDIIFFQETFDDQRHQKNDEVNQLSQINQSLKFKNEIYTVIEQVFSESKKPIDKLVFDGLGCLTNLELSYSGVIRLKRQEQDKHYRSVQVIKIKKENEIITFYNCHFSNTDEWSEMHLEETYEHALQDKNVIIIGDLNIKIPEVITRITSLTHKSSFDFKKYYSYYSKNEVLDYIVIPKNMKFIDIYCSEEGLSDHLGVLATVRFK